VIGAVLIATLLGAVIGYPLLIVVGLWVLYRIVRGWITLADGKPMSQ
jgi:uncharacterized membrane protein